MPAFSQLGFILSLAIFSDAQANEATRWFELIRDGHDAHREEIQEVVGEGTRTYRLTNRGESQQSDFEEEYLVRWYQSGDRLRYEHRITRSNRPGLETDDALNQIGRDIHIVLPDAHILHYESDGTTLIYDHRDWLKRKEGLLRYSVLYNSVDISEFADSLLEDRPEPSKWKPTVREVPGRKSQIAIRRVHASSESQMHQAVWVDVLRGFLPVRYYQSAHLLDRYGKAIISTTQCDVSLTSSTQGVWFPENCRRSDHRERGSVVQVSEDVWKFNRLEINQGHLAGRDDLFSLHGLPLDDGSRVIDKRTFKGYLNDQAEFTYGKFTINDSDLGNHLRKLSRMTSNNIEIERASFVGTTNRYKWDEESNLYLGREPLCSVFALWVVMALEHRAQSFGDIFDLFPKVTPRGVALSEIASAAVAAGTSCQPVQVEFEGLRRILNESRPVILHVDGTHFVTVVEARSEGVVVADFPKVELVPWEKITKSWTGYALAFGKAAPRRGVRLQLALASFAIFCGCCGTLLPIYRWCRGKRSYGKDMIK